jgi:hypothetical protein
MKKIKSYVYAVNRNRVIISIIKCFSKDLSKNCIAPSERIQNQMYLYEMYRICIEWTKVVYSF